VAHYHLKTYHYPLPAAEDRDYSLRWREKGWPLVYVPDALMGHAHHLDLGRFWRQHLYYGRGANYLRTRIAARQGEKVRFEGIRFYALMVGYPFRAQRPRPLPRMVLLGLFQVATTVGFIAEGLGRSRR